MIGIAALLGIAGCGNTGVDRVMVEQERRDRQEEQRLEPIRDEVRAYLREAMSVPDDVRGRMIASLGDHCTLVLDPRDPAGCTAEDCRALLLTRGAEGWSMASMGTLETVRPRIPEDCHVGLTYAGEFRRLDDMERFTEWGAGAGKTR